MKIPLFPLDVVLFPGAPLPLHIFEERYREMVRECSMRESVFGVVCASREGLAVVGCTARIARILQDYPDGRRDILTEGTDRFEIVQLDDSLSYLQADVRMFVDSGREASRELRAECIALHFEVLELAGADVSHISLNLNQPVSFQLARSLPAGLDFKQELLTMRSDHERTERLLEFYRTVLPKLRGGVQARQSAERNGHVM
jgi:Lon protease-like protein